MDYADAAAVALVTVPVVNLIRILLPVKTLYAGNWLIAAVVVGGASWAAGLDPLRTAAAFGLSHVIQKFTRFLEAAGDARRAETVRAARRM